MSFSVGHIYNILVDGDAFMLIHEYEDAIQLYTEGIELLKKQRKDPKISVHAGSATNNATLSDNMSTTKNSEEKCNEITHQFNDEKVRFLLLNHRSMAYFEIYQRLKNIGNISEDSMEKNITSSIQDGSSALDILKSKESLIITNQTKIKSNLETRLKTLHKALSSTRSSPMSTPKKDKSTSPPAVPKYQYYQNDNIMTIAILMTVENDNVTAEDIHVDFYEQELYITLFDEPYNLLNHRQLFEKIDVNKSKFVIKSSASPSKILIKLYKVTKGLEWHDLFDPTAKAVGVGVGGKSSSVSAETKEPTTKKPTASASSTTVAPTVDKNTSSSAPATSPSSTSSNMPGPYATKKDWNAIERSVLMEEEDEIQKNGGEEALNKLFRDIYGRSDENTKRAMIKSFQTSGGTVLSTNWKDVKDTDYEDPNVRQAPKGMEWKNWEGEKVSQKESD